jgi:hypothetical protein
MLELAIRSKSIESKSATTVIRNSNPLDTRQECGDKATRSKNSDKEISVFILSIIKSPKKKEDINEN